MKKAKFVKLPKKSVVKTVSVIVGIVAAVGTVCAGGVALYKKFFASRDKEELFEESEDLDEPEEDDVEEEAAETEEAEEAKEADAAEEECEYFDDPAEESEETEA